MGVLSLIALIFSIQAYEYPNEFQIRQEPSMRAFSVVEGTQFLGEIFNTSYGRFDFYDRNKTKICTNFEDALYDNANNLLSFIEWKKDAEAEKWFWQRKCTLCFLKTHMILFSSTNIPFLTLDEEGEGNSFVFRDCEMGMPIAVALWSWKLLGNSCIAKFDDQVQNWDLIIVDRPFLEEKQISPLLLIWALLKHSQLRFPDPSAYPYVNK
jgi:hypothetical protein